MRSCAVVVLLLVGGCECYARTRIVSMSGKRGATRREVLNGDSITKQFYDPNGWRKDLPYGWSPLLVVTLGAVAASYGGSRRSEFYDEMRVLSSGVKNTGQTSHKPMVTLSPGRASGQVSVEITAAAAVPDVVDAIWVTDAGTGEIFAGRRFLPKEPKELVLVVARGRRFVAAAHCAIDGVWEGDTVVANA